jgi:hypothetical protein
MQPATRQFFCREIGLLENQPEKGGSVKPAPVGSCVNFGAVEACQRVEHDAFFFLEHLPEIFVASIALEARRNRPRAWRCGPRPLRLT